ncbi:MAG: ATP-grasp domain-containing protein [Clostridiales bacterium]|nr:ATP-grasp domain-containing protein [Clostridiales bacterium]
MEDRDSEVPLLRRRLTVGLLYNLKHEGLPGAHGDEEAEYDSIDTVDAISAALTSSGATVVPIEAGADLFDRLQKSKIDIAFNIAEGFHGRGREAQIPAVLNILGIPYTGSDETTLCIALDKALTKRILSTYRIRTPKYALLSASAPAKPRGLRYPVLIKPNAEGSSKGIHELCIARDSAALKKTAEENCKIYGQEMLAEEYIEGREFTVDILGNGEATRVFEPMEIVYKRDTHEGYHVYSYEVKQAYTKYVRYECPAQLTAEQNAEMKKIARRAFDVLGCRDFSRMDFRMAQDGTIHFIEINPLPGLAPGYSDYPMLAEKNGVPYARLVRGILDAALSRLGLSDGFEVMRDDSL